MYKYIILLLFIIISCKSDDSNIIEFKTEEICKNTICEDFNEKSEHITSVNSKIEGIFSNITVLDSLIVCGTVRDEHLINVYSLNNNKLLLKCIPRGTGINEGLSTYNIEVKNDTKPIIYNYDITLNKISKIDLLKYIKDSNSVHQINLAENLKNMISPNIISDSLFIATTYAKTDCRYLIANSKKILKKVGDLPNGNQKKYLKDATNSKLYNKGTVFKAISVAKSNEYNNVAVFYNNLDRVEFYKNGKLNNVIKSENYFNPTMEVRKYDDGYIVNECKYTKKAYLGITHTDKYIYALYSGEINKFSSNKINVFDWKGNFVKQYKLDKNNITNISINPHTNTLYLYDNKENKISSCKL